MLSIRTALTSLIFFAASDVLAKPAGSIDAEIARERLPRESLSLYAVDGGEVLINVNADKRMIPASVTKIVTAATALHTLGVTAKVTTELLSPAPIENGVLKGDLILHGAGDPSFVSESMWVLVNELTRQQINQIEGNIKVDDSLFDTVRFDPSREPVRNDRAYDAPVGAMSMNWNAVNVYIRPGAKVGEPAHVFADPETSYIQVVNHTTTVSGERADITVSRKGKTLEEDDTVEANDALVVSGKIGLRANEKVIYKNISQPEIWSGYNLLAFLRQRGIAVKGSVQAGRVPPGSLVLAHTDSKPVGRMVEDMLKFSNNFVAEMLTKQVGLKNAGAPGSLDKGLEAIRGYLRDLSVAAAPDDAQIFNPSGFSRKNRLSAMALANTLVAVQKDFAIFPELVSALPVAGRDGTLKSRMKTFPEKVRAKTGYMTGIVALAGFVDRGHGEVATFAFLYNGSPDKADVAKVLMDRLCERLAQK